MTVKPAPMMANDIDQFLKKAKESLAQIEKLKNMLETDGEFRDLWESDSAKALESVGINPEARTELGKDAYIMGPECDMCITPNGNACHC